MDFTQLTKEFLEKMYLINKTESQKKVDETMRGEMFALQYIYRRGEQVLPSEISNEANLSTARIAFILNGLERKGLITRQIDRGDRRRIFVNITDKGRELAEEAAKGLMSDMTKMLRALGENDAKELIRILGRIADIIQNYSKRIECKPPDDDSLGRKIRIISAIRSVAKNKEDTDKKK